MAGMDMYPENEYTVRQIMEGGYDLHTHTAPSHYKRGLDDIELARQCDEYGMAGAILKCHYEPTASRAYLANKYSGARAKVYGSIALNQTVGGLNPFAVESTLKLGGRIVWMPTKDAENSLKRGMKPSDLFERPPVRIKDEKGRLIPDFYKVLDVVKKYDAYLATGHISPEEALLVCREARAYGANVILTHPDIELTYVPLEEQIEMAKLGVIVEKVWGTVWDGSITVAGIAAAIKALGAENVMMDSDFGQKVNPRPVYGMHDFIAGMLREGIPAKDLKTMFCDVPARVVGA